MIAVLALCSALFLVYAVLRIPDRPGLFASTIVNSYVFSNYFGPIGVVIAAIALVTSVGMLAQQGRPKIQKPELGLLLWVCFSVICVAASWQIDAGFVYIGSLFVLCLATYMFGRMFGNHPLFIRDLVIGAFLTFVLCEPGLVAASRSITRVSGDINAVGASSVVALPILGCLALLFFHERLSREKFALIMAFLFFAVIPAAVTLGTRSVFIGAGAVLLVFLIFRVREGHLKGLIAGVLGAGAMMAAALGVTVVLLSSRGISPERAFSSLRIGINFVQAGSGIVDRSSLQRFAFYQEALDLFRNAPLFGYGPGAFSYLANNAAETYPHNMILELLVNGGLIGLAMFMCWVAPIGIGVFRKLFQPAVKWTTFFLFGMFLDSLITMQVSFTVVQGKMLFLALGIMVAQLAGQEFSFKKQSEFAGA